jgi:hypothetical protein
MAILRFLGGHVQTPGRPQVFRTRGGAHLAQAGISAVGGTIAPVFSRKDETANLDAVRAQQNEAIGQFDSIIDESIHITNNTEYIARLNEGWSAQVAPGFFERALQAGLSAIRGQWKVVGTP